MLTVGKLKVLLEGLPDDTPVVTGGSDHSYLPTRGEEVQAEILWRGKGDRKYPEMMWEYYDEDNRSLKSTSINTVFLIEGS